MTESMGYLYENQKEELGKKNPRGEEVEENKDVTPSMIIKKISLYQQKTKKIEINKKPCVFH